jgi:FkbH-like protein
VTDKQKLIKCVVWDLDNTLWHGTLLEGDALTLREGVIDILRTLDERGIVHSIASKNDAVAALKRLKSFGVDEYFLVPQIGWGNKSESVARIAETINIGIDTLAFIDDQPFERDEVAHSYPEVLCLDVDKIASLPDRLAFTPTFVTADSRRRRQMYQADLKRRQIEEHFEGPKEEFLATLDMQMTVAPAQEEDLKRAEELTHRTNQLNTSGETFSYAQLRHFAESSEHLLLMAELTDRYGSYGKIGLALIDLAEEVWTIRLLLMSCRVMARGVGAVLINHLRDLARARGVRLQARFVANDRNRMMYMTYKFNHFNELERSGELLLENDLSRVQPPPDYVKLITQWPVVAPGTSLVEGGLL